MRVFVCEFVTGGGLRGEEPSPPLAREGAMMRDALANDLADLGWTVVTSHDDRMRPTFGAESAPVGPGEDVWKLWTSLAKGADAAWVIAPETGGLLARLTRLVRSACPIVVGPDDEAIRIASSKTLTARKLASSVPTPPVWRADEVPEDVVGPFVVKPDDGAGCEATRLLSSPPRSSPSSSRLFSSPLRGGIGGGGGAVAPTEPPNPTAGSSQSLIVQPFIPGEPASLTVLRIDGRTRLLTANRQRVVLEAGEFRFRGVGVGALEDRDGRLAALAEAVSAAIPGLAGIFGIDIVLGVDGPVVIEVNPRLTTAYAGLREALGTNPAALVPPFADGASGAPERARRPVEIAL